MNRVDVAIVGGGFNSLVCAAYIARKGASVAVFEKRETVGGMVGTDEFHPGFKCSSIHQTADLLHPDVIKELGLGRHGLNVVAGSDVTTLLWENRFSVTPKGGDVTPEDVAALAELDRFRGEIGKVLEPVFANPLPEVESPSVGDVVDLLRLGWKMRSLGEPDATEAMRFLPMSIRDVLDERIRSEQLKTILAAPALTGSWLAPRSPGSALGFLYHRPGWIRDILPAPSFVKGGMGALSDAVANAARTAGVEIHTEKAIRRIAVEAGQVRGLELDGGEVVPASVVVSGLDPRSTMLDLVGSRYIDPDALFALKGVRSRGTVALVRLALESLPDSLPNDLLSGRMLLASSLDYLERAFDPVKYGEVPDHPWAEVLVPSLADQTLAPDGGHVVAAWVQSVPLLGETDNSRAEGLARNLVADLDRCWPGVQSRVIGSDVTMPADIQRKYGIGGGCVYHLEPALDQFMHLRPMPGWYGYESPVRGLFLCGPGMHPGGGATGLPGRNCAARVVKQL